MSLRCRLGPQPRLRQIEANADGWAKEIGQSGHASIYGINFDTGQATIRGNSETVLLEIQALRQKSPALRVADAGHTDNVGAKDFNLTLSRHRAQSVVSWLAAHRIAADRLLPGGFDNLVPAAGNTPEEGRAKNRCVDLIKLYRPSRRRRESPPANRRILRPFYHLPELISESIPQPC